MQVATGTNDNIITVNFNERKQTTMAKKTTEIAVQYDPNINGVNKDAVTAKILNELDILDKAVYNGDLEAGERGRIIRGCLHNIRKDMQDVAKLFVEE